jgi:hypothetical protein
MDDSNKSDDLDDKIRQRAYELWEQQGRTGDPEDHWFQAERELTRHSMDPLGATVAEVPPADAVRSAEAADPAQAGIPQESDGAAAPSGPTKRKRRR